MSSAEERFIQHLRAIATAPAARGLLDDAAVLDLPAGRALVLTTDMIAEGVHYLPDDLPADVAWKLLAVNLSDLAAKGAEPVGVLLGYPLGEPAWDEAFAGGMADALRRWNVPLLGGDTIRTNGARTLSLTALGLAPEGGAPSRTEARAGDQLWVSGTIGEAGIGLARARAGARAADPFVRRYCRPEPRLAAGRALASLVSAMSDVSDGLLIDARRMADASGLALAVDLDAVPVVGERMAALTAGDDYELLFAADPARSPEIATISQRLGLRLTSIGEFAPGSGLALADSRGPVPLPERLGYEHAHGDRDGAEGD